MQMRDLHSLWQRQMLFATSEKQCNINCPLLAKVWPVFMFLISVSILDFLFHPHTQCDHHSVSFDLFGAECSIIYGGSYVPTLSNILPRPSFLHFSAKRKMLENVNSWEEYLHNITKHKFTKEAYLNTGKTGVFTSGQNSDIRQVQEYKEIRAHHIDPEALFE